jgi:hypothetical protein
MKPRHLLPLCTSSASRSSIGKSPAILWIGWTCSTEHGGGRYAERSVFGERDDVADSLIRL